MSEQPSPASSAISARDAAPPASPFTRGWVRAGLVVVAALAPIAQLAWSFLGPYEVTDDLETSYAKITEQPFVFELNLATQPVFGLFAVVSALIVGAALWPGARVLASIATVAAVIGGAVGWVSSSGATTLAAAEAGMPVDEALALNASVEGQLGSMISFTAFLLIPLGYLLFGVASVVAARRGLFPLWAAIVFVVATPLILIGGSFSRVFLVVGWVGVVVGVIVAAVLWARRTPSTTV